MPIPVVRVSSPRILGHAVHGQNLDSPRIRFTLRQDHSSLDGHKALGDIETEAAEVTKSAYCLALVLCLDRVGAVLDDLQVVGLRQAHDDVHGTGSSGKMDNQHGLGAWRYRGVERSGVDIQCFWIDIDEHRGRAGVYDGVDRGAESHGRRYDFIPRPDIRRQHAQMQGRRAAVDGDCVSTPPVSCKRVFETSNAWSRSQPAAPHHRVYLGDLFLPDIGGAEHQECITLFQPYLPGPATSWAAWEQARSSAAARLLEIEAQACVYETSIEAEG